MNNPSKQSSSVDRFLKPIGRPGLGLGILIVGLAIGITMTKLSEIRLRYADALPSDTQIKNVQKNSLDALVLGTEMSHDVGPQFADEKQFHAAILRRYIEQMSARLADNGGHVLGGKYRPETQLEPALQLLTSPKGGDVTNSNEIRQAAAILLTTSRVWSQGDRPIAPFTGQLPNGSLKVVEESISQFEAAQAKFGAHPDFPTAREVCMQSRLAMEMVSLFWQQLGDDWKRQEMVGLTDHMGALSAKMTQLAKSLESEERAKVEKYADNISCRKSYLLCLSEGNYNKAREVLLASNTKN